MANYNSTNTGANIDSAVDQIIDSTTDLNIDSNTLVVDKSANAVGIGTTSPDGKLHIQTADATMTANANADDLVVEGATGKTGMSIIGGEASGDSQRLYFGNPSDNAAATITWDYYNDKFNIGSNKASAILTLGGGSGGDHLTIDSSGNVGIGEPSPEGTIGLTINQGANDDGILHLKSSDVGTGFVSPEPDTYAKFMKAAALYGGLQIQGMAEDHASSAFSILMQGYGGQAETGHTDGAQGLFQIHMYEHDGADSLANITANGNVFAIRGRVGGSNRTLFIVDEDGDIAYDGSDAGAYDYAEMFEWEDGNPDNEDRAGYSVSLVGDKIKKSEEGETPIGIVSVKPAVCGDSPLYWKDKWKRDEWGRRILNEVQCVKWEYQHEKEPAVEAIEAVEAQDAVYETVVVQEAVEEVLWSEEDELPEGVEAGDVKTEAQEEETEEQLVSEAVEAIEGVDAKEAVYITKERHYEGAGIPDEVPDNAEYYTKLEAQHSDEYDDSQEYINRKERQEWSAIGLMGKLRMRAGQPTASSWIKMRDEGNDIEMWLVK